MQENADQNNTECRLFLRNEMYTISITFIKKAQIIVCHYLTLARLLLNSKKHKQEIQLRYGAYIL